jgi:hypothetical protein
MEDDVVVVVEEIVIDPEAESVVVDPAADKHSHQGLVTPREICLVGDRSTKPGRMQQIST